MPDQIVHFTFEEYPIRGILVRLNKSWEQILLTKSLEGQSSIVRQLLTEMLTAGALLGSTLKMDGKLLIQILGKGPLSMLLVEVFTNDTQGPIGIRAIAKSNTEAVNIVGEPDISKLIGHGTLSITLEPTEGSQFYQSIIPATAPNVSQLFETYMSQSEQIETKIHLFRSGEYLSGLLLQKLPPDIVSDDTSSKPEADDSTLLETWNRLGLQAFAIDNETAIETSSNSLLQQVFPEDLLRVFEARDVDFQCSCSREKIGALLITLGEEDAKKLIAEEGSIKVTCEFCGIHYEFDPIDTADLFIHSRISGTSAWKN